MSFCRLSMGLDWLPNVRETYGGMFTEYICINKIFADEIINYFLLSWDIEIQVTFAIISMTILVNISLLFAIMITGNVEKFCSSLEVIRGLAEGLMHSIHNSGSFQKYVQHYRPHSMLRRILVFFAGSVNLGLNKVFYRVFAVL